MVRAFADLSGTPIERVVGEHTRSGFFRWIVLGEHRQPPKPTDLRVSWIKERYCATCLQEQLAEVGRGRWLRFYQLPGVYVCRTHGSGLIERNTAPAFVFDLTELRDLINAAESEADKTCCYCGAPARLRLLMAESPIAPDGFMEWPADGIVKHSGTPSVVCDVHAIRKNRQSIDAVE